MKREWDRETQFADHLERIASIFADTLCRRRPVQLQRHRVGRATLAPFALLRSRYEGLLWGQADQGKPCAAGLRASPTELAGAFPHPAGLDPGARPLPSSPEHRCGTALPSPTGIEPQRGLPRTSTSERLHAGRKSIPSSLEPSKSLLRILEIRELGRRFVAANPAICSHFDSAQGRVVHKR